MGLALVFFDQRRSAPFEGEGGTEVAGMPNWLLGQFLGNGW